MQTCPNGCRRNLAAATVAVFLWERLRIFLTASRKRSPDPSQDDSLCNSHDYFVGVPANGLATFRSRIPGQLSCRQAGVDLHRHSGFGFLLLLAEMADYGKGPTKAIERTCHGAFVSVYVGLPMALLVSVRSLGDGNWGLAAILTMIAVTKSTDAGAYFSGKAFGKHKLIPRLSPGKTREGAGRNVTATIVAFVCLKWLSCNRG